MQYLHLKAGTKSPTQCFLKYFLKIILGQQLPVIFIVD